MPRHCSIVLLKMLQDTVVALQEALQRTSSAGVRKHAGETLTENIAHVVWYCAKAVMHAQT